MSRQFRNKRFLRLRPWSIKVWLLVVAVALGAVLAKNLLFVSAAPNSIFNVPGSKNYFFNKSERPSHNVLPPIYNYNEYVGAPRPAAYALDINRLFSDAEQLTKMKEMWGHEEKSLYLTNADGFIQEINRIEREMTESIKQKLTDPTGSYNKYKDLLKKGRLNALNNPNWLESPNSNKKIDPAFLCAHNLTRNYNGNNLNPSSPPTDESSFISALNTCKTWVETGYRFVRYSLVGVPQNLAMEDIKNGNQKNYDNYYSEMKSAGNVELYVQYMPLGGKVNYYESPNTNNSEEASNQNPLNTAITPSRRDVIGYDGTINPSMAITAWNVSGAGGKPTLRWSFRLRCANPITTNLATRDVVNPIEVTGRVVSSKISTKGTAEIEFTYKIAKRLNNFPLNAKTPIQYKFSGTPAGFFNHSALTVTKREGTDDYAVGSNLSVNPTLLDTPVRSGAVEFTEKYTIDKKLGNYEKIGDSYVVCRRIHTEAANQAHNFTQTEVKKLKHEAEYCVRVKEHGQGASGKIEVLNFEPSMASIGMIPNPGRGGVNTRVVRSKQWVDRSQGMSATDNSCSNYPMSGGQRMQQECDNKCKPKLVREGYVWVRERETCYHDEDDGWTCYETVHHISTSCQYYIPREGSWEEISYDEEGRVAVKNVYQWAHAGNCGDDDNPRGPKWVLEMRRWYGALRRDKQGSDEDHIQCQLVDVYSWSPTCENCRCIPTYWRARCEWKHRNPSAKWEITEMIFKPEVADAPPEKGGLPFKNEDMTLESNLTPLQYYCDKSAPFKGDKMECDTIHQGVNDIDNTKVFSMERGWVWNALMNIVISPTGTDNVFYRDAAYQPASPGIVDVKRNRVAELPTGTVVCYGLSLHPWVNDGKTAALWAHSQPKCYTVSKKPYFAVENGMIVTNGMIKSFTNTRLNDTKVGSWAEYNAIANGPIDMFSTNLGSLGNTAGGLRIPVEQWGKLAFANKGASLGGFGYDLTQSLVDPVSFFTALKEGDYAGTTVTKHGSGTISSLGAGIHLFEGNLTISGDVGVAGQTVIAVKGDVEITRNVSSINAWLIVDGKLVTSDQALEEGSNMRFNGDKQLVFNGPVRANEIELRRTYGAGIWSPESSLGRKRDGSYGTDQLDQPAEIFRDTPETYIWSYKNALNKGRVQTVYLREVAPRY